MFDSINLLKERIFSIENNTEFEGLALEIFHYQAIQNKVYAEFIRLLEIDHSTVHNISDIPFLPIQLFKSNKVICDGDGAEIIFTSSGTTGMASSKHYVKQATIYESSFTEGFKHFYGEPSDYCILALLPSYLEREGSSLIYMMDALIKLSAHPNSGFYLNQYDQLASTINHLKRSSKKILLLGVSFALIEFAEKCDLDLPKCVVMETGGMKGKRKEIVREELHGLLNNKFGTNKIHSEYGMTELLSQAYSNGDGLFKCPPWMRVLTRELNDPFKPEIKRTGGINVIDLAYIYSCSFIATSDLGKVYHDHSFEVLGRFDNSDLRGCNLMIS